MKKSNKFQFLLLTIVASMLIINTGFSQVKSKLNATIRTETIEKLTKMLAEFYFYPETTKKMVTQLKENLKNGKYNKIEEFGQFGSTLTTDLFEIAKDKHLRIYYSPSQVEYLKKFEVLSESEKEEQSKKDMANLSKTNFGFDKQEILKGNIGYLKLSRFELVNDESSETAFSAMKYISNSDAVILDLRENGGGSATMIQLIGSYFYNYDEFENKVLFEEHYMPKNEIIPYRVLPCIPGKRMVKIPLYILVDKNSFSAAEIFAYSLQKLGRAIIVGEQTNFGVNSCKGSNIINDYYTITIPVGTMISPVTKSNCEGIGVIPDIKTESRNALDTVLKIINAKQNVNELRKNEIAPDENFKQYIGVYEFNPANKATIKAKGMQVFAEITGRPGDFEIFQMDKDKYNVPGFGIEFAFIRENEIITGLNFSRNGKVNYAKKIK